MSKAVFVLLVLSIFFLYKPVLAAGEGRDPSTTVTHEPMPYSPDQGNLKIKIHSTRDIFTGSQYSYIIHPKNTRADYCVNPSPNAVTDLLNQAERQIFGDATSGTGTKFWDTVSPKSVNDIEVDWSPNKSLADVCKNFYGTWTFGMWQGTSIGEVNKDSVIAGGYEFQVEAPGGAIPEIIPLDSPLAIGTVPTAIIINARKGQTYMLWWEGMRGYTKVTAPENTNLEVEMEKNHTLGDTRDIIKTAGTKKLCMEVTNLINTLRLTCRYSTIFRFQAIVPPAQLSCEIIPNPPRENDSISLKATGLDKNKIYLADLVRQVADLNGQPINQTQEIKQPISVDNFMNNGTLLVNLKSSLPRGFDVVINLYEAGSSAPVCSEQISVEDKNTARVPNANTKICTPSDPDCTTSAVNTCGTDGNLGIPTAIGCIHTAPVAFIKDFMTFVIGISGGLAFLMMLSGAFQMITSAGNPETLKAGQDRLTSAVIGLLMVIFATLLLQIIGVNILGIFPP